MADAITAKQEDSKFRPHSAGTHVAKCVDVIDFGECVSEFPGKPKSLSPKMAFVFRTGEKNEKTGEVIDIVAEYGLFLSAKAKLRALIESWLGKTLTPDQVRDGVPLEKMEGRSVLLNIGHKTSPASGRTYAIVLSAMPVPKGTTIPTFESYTRPDYLVDRKANYKKVADAYRIEIGMQEHEESDGFESEPQKAEDDDLPFD